MVGRKIYSEIKGALSTFMRFKLGSETKNSQYWRSEEEKVCKLSVEERESLIHILEK